MISFTANSAQSAATVYVTASSNACSSANANVALPSFKLPSTYVAVSSLSPAVKVTVLPFKSSAVTAASLPNVTSRAVSLIAFTDSTATASSLFSTYIEYYHLLHCAN